MSERITELKFNKKPCNICNDTHEFFKNEEYQFVFTVFCEECLSGLKNLLMPKTVENREFIGTNTGDQILIGTAKQKLERYLSIFNEEHSIRSNEIIFANLSSHKIDSLWEAAIYVNGAEIVLCNTSIEAYPGKTDEEIENICIEELMEFFFTNSLYDSFKKLQPK